MMRDFFEKYAERIMPEPMSGCWIWFWSQTSSGYGNFTRNGKTHYAHHCAYDAVHGDGAHEGIVVRHQCDFPSCCNPDHLLGGTHKDNSDDAWRRGRMHPAKGEDNNLAVMTEDVVIAARQLTKSGVPLCDISRQLGFHRSTVEAAIMLIRLTHTNVEGH